MRCPTCSSSVPANARFCRKCGRPAPSSNLPGKPAPVPVEDPGVVPARAAMPFAGKLFLVCLVLGPVLLLLGWTLHAAVLLYLGFGVLLGIVAFLGIGSILS